MRCSLPQFVLRPRNHLMLLGLVAILSACGATFDPPSLINKLRVLGVVAEAPQIEFSRDSNLSMLYAAQTPDEVICYAWAFCPYAWNKDGNFRCLDADLQVDLGVAATATVGVAQLFQSLQNASKVFDKLGMTLPKGADAPAIDLGCLPGGKAPANSAGGGLSATQIPEMYILFQISAASTWGGTCPKDSAKILEQVCGDRDNCVAGYKRIALATQKNFCTAFDAAADPPCAKSADACAAKQVCGCDNKTYVNDCARIAAKASKANDGACAADNHNPTLSGLSLDGVDWPNDVTPLVAEGEHFDFEPQWLENDKELLCRKQGSGKTDAPACVDPLGEDQRETLLFSWFTDHGVYEKERTYDAVANNGFDVPAIDGASSEMPVHLWMVVRDGRNGTAWMQRQLVVKRATAGGIDAHKNPICTARNTAKGCDKVDANGVAPKATK